MRLIANLSPIPRSFMKTLFIGLVALIPLISASRVLAQPTQANWFEITRNAVGDRFMVERSSIELRDGIVWYWEYRDFPQPNNAFIRVEIDQPVYGAMLYRSVDCASGVSRLRRVVVYDRERQVIQRINYDDEGPLTQPQEGSSAAAVLNFVCEQPQPIPATSQ